MIFWVVMIVIIIISFLLCKCFSIFGNILDDASKNPEKFSNYLNGKVENFGNISDSDKCCVPVVFSSPSTVSIPANESIPITYTGGNYNKKKELEKGKYCFPISKLLYDGIWDRNVISFKNGYQENIWTLPKDPIKESNYYTNKFLHTPEQKFIANENFSKNDQNCNSRVNLVMNCCY